MMQLDYHLQTLEAEKYKLRAQVRRLCQENAWLRDELGSTQKKFHECEQINASYSVQIEHLQFVKDLKEADNEEDDANIFGSCTDLFTLPSESENGAFHFSNDYEVPTRLQTLHNLVLEYVSQGRHEVAIPLCQQSLDDLEKASRHQRKREMALRPAINGRNLLIQILMSQRCSTFSHWSIVTNRNIKKPSAYCTMQFLFEKKYLDPIIQLSQPR